MLSVIICSRSNDVSSELKENISATIGCEYEMVVIDNSKNQYNIFQAYNEGVRRAKGDILCFMHDDILYHSENWGNKVCEYFDSYPDLGCLGVAGSHLVLDAPASFWHSEASCLHFYGHDSDGNLLLLDNTADEVAEDGLIKVCSVDGLWMSIRKSLFETIRFDDHTFQGFHCYDSDICMQIIQAGYDIGIAVGVLVEHGKRGTQNSSYFESIRAWHKKWTGFLPVVRGAEFSDKDIVARTALVRHIISLEEQVNSLVKVFESKSYRFGKAILRPLKRLRIDFP